MLCREDTYGGTSIYIDKSIKRKMEISKSNNFVELIGLTLSYIKIDYRSVKSFYCCQKCGINNFDNTVGTILNN